MIENIIIKGAREHNLKNIDLDIPRNKLVVFTGVSGSGKSSLAFDTIYADGQRRYVESLSAYARQFLDMMQKPDVDMIEGLSPAISIEQKTTSRNPRSTVGTVTEIYDYLRVLFARVGIPHSPATGLPIESQTVSQMVDRIMALGIGTKLLLMSPMIRGRKGEYKKEITAMQQQGFRRLRIDGEIYNIESVPELNKKVKHNIDIVIDRIALKDNLQDRLADSIETALNISDERLIIVHIVDTGEDIILSEKFACPVSGFTIEEISPRLFSFNNPFGACPHCDGLGNLLKIDEALVVKDKSKTIHEGAIEPWANQSAHYYRQTLESICQHFNANMHTAFEKLGKNLQQALLYGTTEKIRFIYDDGTRHYETHKNFEGVINNLERRFRETESNHARDDIARYQTQTPCSYCENYRLKAEALTVKIDHLHIGHVTEKNIMECYQWIDDLYDKLNEKERTIAEGLIKEIRERLGFLLNVGLDYLTLSRSSGTLSGGESQRIRLASQIGSGLTGVLYVLDEPSIGLHQRDNDRLLKTLCKLRDQGNSVIVVEHDEDAITQADYLVELGPGAGIHGGSIAAIGEPNHVFKHADSITAKYIRGDEKISIPQKRRQGNGHFLEFKGCRTNNLKNINVSIPLGMFVCVTGVSGGGKSSLIVETIQKSLSKELMRAYQQAGDFDSMSGHEYLDKIIVIDQSPIGRTPRSNPATYTGVFGPIRDWFAALPQAKARGYKAGRFSFNVKGGRCEACSGDGVVKIEMHFLSDVYVTCDQCHGKRYNRETLEITYRNKSIADILDLTVEEGVKFFSAIPVIRDKLQTLYDVGLSYVKIGQAATTLSGGEAQRVKLSKELTKRATGKTIYILDEPTTGLHFDDIRKLLVILQRLVNDGNSIIVIEHNLDVIKSCDWIIDVGPEGGHKGGKIIAEGTPEQIIKKKNSYTGEYLKTHIERDKKRQLFQS